MTTPRSIIEEAFGYTTVKAEEEPLTASMLERARLILNDILEEKNTAGLLSLDGFASGDIDTDINEPRYATRFLKMDLALNLQPFYTIQSMGDFQKAYKNAKSAFYAGAVNNQAANFPSTLPKGSGNYDDSFPQFFNDENSRNF